MKNCHIHQVDQALIAAAERYDFVLAPGLYDSCADHWQTVWQNRYPFWKRIALRNWTAPYIELWIGALRRQILQFRRPTILVGHSFGALASACVAQELPEKVAGLMLVAPAEPSRFGVEDIVPEYNLGVPSVMVASRNDFVMDFPRAKYWSSTWGAELVDVGEAGHVNAEAGFGSWQYGLEILRNLSLAVDMESGESSRGYQSTHVRSEAGLLVPAY